MQYRMIPVRRLRRQNYTVFPIRPVPAEAAASAVSHFSVSSDAVIHASSASFCASMSRSSARPQFLLRIASGASVIPDHNRKYGFLYSSIGFTSGLDLPIEYSPFMGNCQ